MTKNNIDGSVIAITGAGSGIGRALAIECAEMGAQLALSDINANALQDTLTKCKTSAGKAHLANTVDVSDKQAVHDWAAECHAHHGKINVVINNAGVALSASFNGSSDDDFEWLMGINFWGVIYGCRAFIPYLKQADWAHIVNISSLFGLIGVPNFSAYCAAKFAVRGFSESLQMEFKQDGSNIGVSSIHPGGIKTNIANSARTGAQAKSSNGKVDLGKEFEALARTTPEQAAKIIIKGIINKRQRVLVGGDAKLISLIQRIFPSAYKRLILAKL